MWCGMVVLPRFFHPLLFADLVSLTLNPQCTMFGGNERTVIFLPLRRTGLCLVKELGWPGLAY